MTPRKTAKKAAPRKPSPINLSARVAELEKDMAEMKAFVHQLKVAAAQQKLQQLANDPKATEALLAQLEATGAA